MHHSTSTWPLLALSSQLVAASLSNLNPLLSQCRNKLDLDEVIYSSLSPAAFGVESSKHVLDFEPPWMELKQSEPWSFPPACVMNRYQDEPVCVFTSQSFASGRGISIVTYPSIVADVLESEAFDFGGNSTTGDDIASGMIAREIPGKGIGLVAERALYRGTQLFSTTPVLIALSELSDEDKWGKDTSRRLMNIGVDRLPEKSRELVYALAAHEEGIDPVVGRVNTNAFESTLAGTEESHVALLPEISRMNHECRPNTLYYWDPYLLRHVVHVATNIYPGEELSLTYIDPSQSRAVRMHRLKSNWGFDCTCRQCSLDRHLAGNSDIRLGQLNHLHTRLTNWTAGAIVDPQGGELLISMYEQEGLFIGRAAAHQTAALNWNAYGEFLKAIPHATLAVELGTMDDGPDSFIVTDMLSLLRNPMAHWSYRKRVPRPTAVKNGGKKSGADSGST